MSIDPEAGVPVTATSKIDKLALRRERWEVADPVYYRPEPEPAYRLLTGADRARIRRGFTTFGRANLLR